MKKCDASGLPVCHEINVITKTNNKCRSYGYFEKIFLGADDFQRFSDGNIQPNRWIRVNILVFFVQMHILFMFFQAIRPIERLFTSVAFVSHSLVDAANMTLQVNLTHFFAAKVARDAFLHVNQLHVNFHAVRSRKSLPTDLKEGESKPGRVVRCVSQVEILVFGGFALMLTDIRTDTRTDGQTLIQRCEDASKKTDY